MNQIPSDHDAAVDRCERGLGVSLASDEVVLTDDDFIDAGVTDVRDINENHGTWTRTLDDGNYHRDQVADNHMGNPSDDGIYLVDGNEITFTYPGYPATSSDSKWTRTASSRSNRSRYPTQYGQWTSPVRCGPASVTRHDRQ